MGHLATRTSLVGEVAATLSLGFLLQNQQCRTAVNGWWASVAHDSVTAVDHWEAEFVQPDQMRPDLLGRVDGVPVVAVEAKFGGPAAQATDALRRFSSVKGRMPSFPSHS